MSAPCHCEKLLSCRECTVRANECWCGDEKHINASACQKCIDDAKDSDKCPECSQTKAPGCMYCIKCKKPNESCLECGDRCGVYFMRCKPCWDEIVKAHRERQPRQDRHADSSQTAQRSVMASPDSQSPQPSQWAKIVRGRPVPIGMTLASPAATVVNQAPVSAARVQVAASPAATVVNQAPVSAARVQVAASPAPVACAVVQVPVNNSSAVVSAHCDQQDVLAQVMLANVAYVQMMTRLAMEPP